MSTHGLIERRSEEGAVAAWFEELPVVLFQIDQDGRWVYLGRGWRDLTGQPAGSVFGQGVADSVHPQDWQPLTAAIGAALQGPDQILRHTSRFLTTTGEYRALELFGRVGTSGRLLGVLRERLEADRGAAQAPLDGVRHRGAEPSLASERELSAILSSLQDTYFRLDEQGNIALVSESVWPLLGMAAGDLVGKPMRELYVEPRQHGVLLRKLSRRAGSVTHHESRLRRRDGSEVWVSINAHEVLAEDGRRIGVEGTARDVTEQKRIKDALRRNERLLEKAQAIGHMGSWDWDLASGNLVWSDETYRIFGVREGEVQPSYQFVAAAVHSDDLERFERAVRDAIEKGGIYRADFRILRPDGGTRCVRTEAEVTRDSGGKALRMVGMVQDVTDQKREQEQLLQVARGVSAKTGERFFQSLVSHFAGIMGADYVLVAEVRERCTQARTIAVLAQGRIVDNFDYALAGTPCAQVASGACCVFARDVQSLFPEDHMLVDMGVQAYIGQILEDSSGQALGLLAVLYREPVQDVARIQTTLQIFAARAAAELERTRMEQALAKATREWTQAMDAFEDPIYITDLDDKVLRGNRAFFRMVGMRPKQAIGRPIAKLLHPDLSPDDCPVCRVRRAHRDTYITVEPGSPNNPTGRPYEVQVRTLRDADGRPVGTLMARHDLSRAREAADAVRRVNDHLRLVLESTDEGIFGVDRELRCTFVNHAAARILGYKRSDLLGKDLHSLVHHSTDRGVPLPRSRCLISRTVEEGSSFRSDEQVFWRQDGMAVPVQFTSNPTVEGGTVTGAVVVFRDVAEAREMKRHMDYLATHDSLTGLINRYEFERRLERLIESAHAGSHQHVLCYLDLDQFKIVNDTCGHVAGDELLSQLSGLLLQRLRPADTVARLGGDEFGILFERCSLDEALDMVGEMRETVRDFRFAWDDKSFKVGVSVGMVVISADTTDRATALSQADSACYLAKDRGRNRVHVYQADDVELMRRHGEMQWVARIQQALEAKSLALYRQAIVPARGGSRDGVRYEILLRMRGDDGELVPPGAFLPAAERYNLVSALDRWVVESVLDWLTEHPKQLAELTFCTINLSGHTLGDEQFLGFLVHRLQDRSVLARKLCFELTETAAVSNLSRAVHFFRELKQLGCRFALDDFGSGMSSFAYLKNLPVDFLKIDGNFVKDIAHDPVDYAMVEAINRVGHVMGLQTIAEFVESDAVFESLRAMGVDYAQGYALGRPQPLAG